MSRIASLGMYEFPETAPALDLLWAGVAAELHAAGMADVPAGLARDRPLRAMWSDPDLLLGQTCGYPLRTELAGAVRLVATPVYDWLGCRGAWHRSFIVVGAESSYGTLADLRGSRAALNGYDSNTGMNLFRAALAPVAESRPMFRSVVVTGAHADSLAAVAGGTADVAAIDCVSLGLLVRARPELAGRVRILAETPESPSLPLVTSRSTSEQDIDVLRSALVRAIALPAMAEVRAVLGLGGFLILGEADYDVVLSYEADAVAAGYPRLR